MAAVLWSCLQSIIFLFGDVASVKAHAILWLLYISFELKLNVDARLFCKSVCRFEFKFYHQTWGEGRAVSRAVSRAISDS